MVEAVPQGLQDLQSLLLQAAQALGLCGTVDGQPAWPATHRIAVETLALDAALTRQWLIATVMSLCAAVAMLLATVWRRQRLVCGLLAAVLACTAPWPPTRLWLAPATATSFHRAPSAVTVEALAQGLTLYSQHCADCHGVDGRGETATAARLPVWPPRLSGSLLWKRAEGESYGHVRSGMRTREGLLSMPGFASVLTPQQTWDVLAAVRVLASGQTLREEGRWGQPLAAPIVQVRCAQDLLDSRQAWLGEPVQWVILAPTESWPRADPRLETAVLRQPGSVAHGPPPPDRADCHIASDPTAVMLVVRALLGFMPRQGEGGGQAAPLPGVSLLIDRKGWLRAWTAHQGGRDVWRASDLVCRSGTSLPSDARTGTAAEDLDGLLRRMDSDPVPVSRLGRINHATGP